jgi:hypothetical protein
MEDINEFESLMGSKIRRFLIEEGYLFPTSDNEIEDSLKKFNESNFTFPSHIDNPLIYLYPPTPKPSSKIAPMHSEQDQDYLKDFTALAAREGIGEIPPEILDQMKKDIEDESKD